MLQSDSNIFLQSQLRNRLATELHKTMKGSVGPSLPGSPRKSMRVQVADRIVAEYLNSVGYEYSLSIFLPEAGTSMEKVREKLHFCSIEFT